MENNKELKSQAIQHYYLHVDLDAFFASVEQLDNPSYKGKPVIVGGLPEDRRSVVSTASYEARKYGVHSAMPIFQAYKLCPNGIYVRGRMHRYTELSCRIMNIFKEFSPDVQQMSIDEAFIDITGTEKLFGKPEEIAAKIKKKVFEETGLTVSIGLAATKYLAKIASGYNKPDGFYYVKPGTEQDFMLSLPLNKVWGLGVKSIEVLNNHGIKTTRQIYNIPFDSLKLIFGKSMATFLYNTVRGIEAETFSTRPKSHSISSETTFAYDITDSYTAQTELLELAQGVMFRLLKEGGFSKTAFIKIRYDDFSTVSAQQTVDTNIKTLDSFFEILKNLFEKKYISGRGIRLLGVGFENIEETELTEQLTLFEDINKKKNKVEKAILELSKKHPEIKIQKARTLKNNILIPFLLLIMNLFFAKNIYAQELISEKSSDLSSDNVLDFSEDNVQDIVPQIEAEQAEELPVKSNDYEDENVELDVSGYWLGEFSASAYSTFEEGESPSFSEVTPVYTQKVDLAAHLLLNKHFFFNGEFSDEFKDSLLETGYVGNDFVKEIKFANKGINFPGYYSTVENGYFSYSGNKFSPGVEGHFSNTSENLFFDFMADYENSKTVSKTYYGMNEVQQSYLKPDQFLYGTEFIFPKGSENILTEVKDIYVENIYGQYLDKDGNKYKKLDSSQYFIFIKERKILISPEAKSGKIENQIPKILVTFLSESDAGQIKNLCGDYDDENSYKGKIQKQFKDSIQLKDYEYELISEINGENALKIQNEKNFSPFLCCNTYISKEDAQVYVVNQKSMQEISSYECSSYYKENSYLNNDYFRALKFYSEITNKNTFSTECPQFPFAKEIPEIYLSKDYESDLLICVQTLTQVQNYLIGNSAAKDSVKVYINGIQDTYAFYSKESGIVKLSKTISETDKIYITYTEDSPEFSEGNVSVAAGMLIKPSDYLNVDFSLTGLIPTIEENPHFAAFGSGIEINKNGFYIKDSLTAAVNKAYIYDDFNAKNKIKLQIIQEDLIYLNKDYLIKNLNLSADSEQNFFINDVFEKSKDKPEEESIFLNQKKYDFSTLSNLNGEITILKLTLGGNVSFTENEYLSAGHIIKTDKPFFSILDFSEAFQQNKTDKTLSKTDEAKLSLTNQNLPVNFLVGAKTEYSLFNILENQGDSFVLNLSTIPYSCFSTSFSAEAIFSQKRKNNNYLIDLNFPSQKTYDESYKHSGKNQLSGGWKESHLKTETYTAKLSQRITEYFTPSIIYSLNSEDTTINNSLFTDSEQLGLDLPFTFENYTLGFGISRNARTQQDNIEILDYKEGSCKLFNSQNDRLFFYQSIPFYELFESEKGKNLPGLYNSTYDFSYKRKLFYKNIDIIIPSNVLFSASRDTTKKTDIYQLKNSIEFRGINLNPYIEDETFWGISSLLKFPYVHTNSKHNGLLAYNFKIFQTTFLYFNNTSVISFGNEARLQTDLIWDITANISYSRNGNSSLTQAILTGIFNYKNNFYITRKDSLSYTIGSSYNIIHQKIDYKHSTETKIIKNFATTSLVNTIFTITDSEKMTAFMSLTFGGKLEF